MGKIEKGILGEDDAVLLLIYNKIKQEAAYETAQATRSCCEAEMEYPQAWKENELVVYLGFCNLNAKEVSNSVCLFNGDNK